MRYFIRTPLVCQCHFAKESLMPVMPSAIPTRLQSRAYQEIRRLITSGEFPPGTFLSERQLANQLGMSKTPVHVALERLEAEGFVSISAQQGIVVRGISVEDILDLYEMREAIESWTIRRLAGNLNDTQIQHLQSNLDQQKQALATVDLSTFRKLDDQWHTALTTFLGNREMLATMSRLRDKIQQSLHRATIADHTRPAQSVIEHEAILTALVKGQSERAAQLMIGHLEAGKSQLLNPKRFA